MNKIIIKIPQHKTRAHNVLFFHDTPYKPKKVELKTRYKRQPKHKQTADFG